jgi:hypothetical protein
MKGLKKVFLLLVVFLCLPVFSVFAEEPKKDEEPKVTGSGSLGVYNQYIFRGYEIGKSGLVAQPRVSGATLTQIREAPKRPISHLKAWITRKDGMKQTLR